MSGDRVPLSGSKRTLPSGARQVGEIDTAAPAEVTVLVRRRVDAPAPGGERVSRDEFAARLGADPADIAAVTTFAAEHGLAVVASDAARRTVVLSGTIGALAAAFGAQLAAYEDDQGRRFRGRTEPVNLPAELEPIVDAVLGLDDRPQTHPHFRLHDEAHRKHKPHLVLAPFTPTEVARLYGFPADVDGTGETVAILEFGGGFVQADLDAYFAGLGLSSPRVVAVSVDGGVNAPTGDGNGPDGEVMLDVEVVGAVARGATIAVYFAPNTERGFVDAITTAVHDRTNAPSVVSISWGQAEENWSLQAVQALDSAFQDAGTLGVTVCCASGDDGSSDRVGDGLAHVDFPAASPHVLACGGTELVAGPAGTIASETVWHDAGGGSTGGGVSTIFSLPPWQASAGVPVNANPGGKAGRGVPDVSGDAAPATGYRVRVDGSDAVIGGTSAVAPLWAGLVALINQRRGASVGFLNPHLYGAPRTGLRDVVAGSNGAYSAGKGWDACTGLGSPDGSALADSLGAATGASTTAR